MFSRRATKLYAILSLIFFALFFYQHFSDPVEMQVVEHRSWSEMALSGRLIVMERDDLDRRLIEIDPVDGQTTTLFNLQDRAWMEQAIAAPDSPLVLSYAPPPTSDFPHYSQPNLYALNANSDLMPLLDERYPDQLFLQPTWCGEHLYYTRQIPREGGYQIMIERWDSRNGAIEQVANNALWAAASNGQIAYVGFDLATNSRSLMHMNKSSGEAVVLIPPGRFADIDAPFFSPDGTWIYFAAAEAIKAMPTPALGLLIPVNAHPGDASMIDWWRVQATGGTPERLTRLGDFVLRGVFSPDGMWIAFVSMSGLYIMTPDGQRVIQLAALPAADTLIWLPSS